MAALLCLRGLELRHSILDEAGTRLDDVQALFKNIGSIDALATEDIGMASGC